MKHFIFCATWAVLLFALPLHGQNFSACSTPSPTKAPIFDDSQTENLFANPLVVQIFVHILRDDDAEDLPRHDDRAD